MSSVRGLFRDYGDFKVDIPQWEFPDQGVTALVGPSGSGKTSVFRLLIGLEPCPTLSWIFKDEDLAKLPVPEKKLGVVFQTLELFSHLTIYENLRFAEKARKISESEGHDLRNHVVEVLKLAPRLDHKTSTLSGGEKQRVALARALVGRPRFLFLDEPFSAVDEVLRADARSLLKRCVDEFHIPTLLVTHDPRDVAALEAREYHIHDGRLQT